MTYDVSSESWRSARQPAVVCRGPGLRPIESDDVVLLLACLAAARSQLAKSAMPGDARRVPHRAPFFFACGAQPARGGPIVTFPRGAISRPMAAMVSAMPQCLGWCRPLKLAFYFWTEAPSSRQPRRPHSEHLGWPGPAGQKGPKTGSVVPVEGPPQEGLGGWAGLGQPERQESSFRRHRTKEVKIASVFQPWARGPSRLAQGRLAVRE